MGAVCAGRYESTHDMSLVTVLNDVHMRVADGHPRQRVDVEVVPPNDGFVPEGCRGLRKRALIELGLPP